MPRRFLVGHDGSPASTRALAEAARLACIHHGRVTVVLAAPPVPRWVVLSPVSVLALEREACAEAEQELCRGVKAIPDCVSVTTVQSSHSLGSALLGLWCRGEHDAVVLAAPGPFAARRSAIRLLRRAGVEPTLVPAPQPKTARLRARQLWRRRARAARRARPAVPS